MSDANWFVSSDGANLENADRKLEEIDSRLENCSDNIQKANLFLSKAVIYGSISNLEEARKQLTLAKSAAPDDPDVELQHDYLQAILYHAVDAREAFERFGNVLLRHSRRLSAPDARFLYEDIQQRRAFELVSLGRFSEATSIFHEILQFTLLDQDRSNALAAIGLCYSHLEDFPLAMKYLKAACDRGLTVEYEGEVHFEMGVCFACTGLLKEAQAEFEECEKKAEQYQCPLDKVYQWLAWVHQKLGETGSSRSYEQLAVEINRRQ